MNRIVCVTGVLCLTGMIAIACGGDDDGKLDGDGLAGSGGTGGSGTGGTSTGGVSSGGTSSGGTSTGGTSTGGTSTGGTSTGGTTTGGTGGSTPDGGNTMPDGGNTMPDGGNTTPDGGGTLGQPFDMCTSDAECADGLVCLRSGQVNGQPSQQLPGYCTVPGCQNADANICAQPTSGNVESTCSPTLDVCTLDCSAQGAECPTGMECQTVGLNQDRCVYPEQTVPLPGLYEQCTVQAGCGSAGPDAGALQCNPYLLFCSEPCTGVADCTTPTSGTAALLCSMTTGQCILDCSGGAECPTGMTCAAQPGGQEYCSY